MALSLHHNDDKHDDDDFDDNNDYDNYDDSPHYDGADINDRASSGHAVLCRREHRLCCRAPATGRSYRPHRLAIIANRPYESVQDLADVVGPVVFL